MICVMSLSFRRFMNPGACDQRGHELRPHHRCIGSGGLSAQFSWARKQRPAVSGPKCGRIRLKVEVKLVQTLVVGKVRPLVVSDVVDVSGRRMIEALIAGETDPQVLAALAHRHIKASAADLEAALRGRVTAHAARRLQKAGRRTLGRVCAIASSVAIFRAILRSARGLIRFRMKSTRFGAGALLIVADIPHNHSALAPSKKERFENNDWRSECN